VLEKYNQAVAEKTTESSIKQAGFKHPTPLQEKVIPLALQGKDLIVEARNSNGKSVSILLPIILKIKDGGNGIKGLVLASELDQIKKLRTYSRRLSTLKKNNPGLGFVGLEENIKKELKLLSKNPDIIVGTAPRIIDHIRRENIDLSGVEMTVIFKTSNAEEGFDKDTQFIFSKLPNNQQTVLFCEVLDEKDEALLYGFLRRPVFVSYSDFHTAKGEHSYFEAGDEQNKLELLVKIFYSRDLNGSLIICKTAAIAEEIEKRLNQEGIKAKAIGAEKKNSTNHTIQNDFNLGYINALVTSKDYASEIKVRGIRNIIYVTPAAQTETYVKNLSHVEKTTDEYSVITLSNQHELPLIKQLEEDTNMSIKKEENPDDNEVIRGTLKKIVTKVREEEDPEELTYYKKLFKQNVPLTMRAYVAAYLLKYSLLGDKKKQRTLKTLFVSVGKNRKVYPKDLARFFSSNLGIKHGEIGNIKVLDSYSFIDLPEEYCENAIKQLNGKEFRGRKITVNHARKKEEKNVSVS
jgi:ATP-dependent RNA helicase DeaD